MKHFQRNIHKKFISPRPLLFGAAQNIMLYIYLFSQEGAMANILIAEDEAAMADIIADYMRRLS